MSSHILIRSPTHPANTDRYFLHGTMFRRECPPVKWRDQKAKTETEADRSGGENDIVEAQGEPTANMAVPEENVLTPTTVVGAV